MDNFDIKIPKGFIPEGSDFVCYYSKKKALVILIISLFFFTSGCFYLLKNGFFGAEGFVISSLVLFGIVGAYAAIRILRNKISAIRISPKGIEVTLLLRVATKSIHWDEIAEIKIVKTRVNGVDASYLEITGGAQDIQRNTPLSRFIFRENAKKRRAIAISQQTISCTLEELSEFLMMQFIEHIGDI